MPGLDMLDTLIGLVTIYVTLSLLVTAIGEGVSQHLGFRSKNLALVMENLLGKTQAQQFYQHPRIRQLCPVRPAAAATHSWLPNWLKRGYRAFKRKFHMLFAPGLPSYIPADTVIEVMLELWFGKEYVQLRTSPLLLDSKVTALSLEQVPLPATLSTIQTLWQRAAMDPGPFEKQLMDWFDDTGHRSVGWFKRRLGVWQLGIGLIVAIALNANTILIYQRLTSDDGLRQQYLAAATQLVSNKDVRTSICQSAGQPDNCDAQTVARLAASVVTPVVGWQNGLTWDNFCAELGPASLIGWLLTAFALSLGAPFWFDLLQKMMALRQKFRSSNNDSEYEDKSKESGNTATSTLTSSLPLLPGLLKAAVPVQQVLTEFKPDLLSADLQQHLWLARLADLVYLPASQVAQQLTAWGAAGELYDVGGGTQFLFCSTGKVQFVVCRGTELTLDDVQADLKVKLIDWPLTASQPDLLAHQGFAGGAASIVAKLQTILTSQPKALPIWFSGHSLGGALAVLVALQLRLAQPQLQLGGIVTFGQPKVGNPLLLDLVLKHCAGRYYRYVNQRDIVPTLPPLPNYQHCGSLMYFDDLDRLLPNPPSWQVLLDKVMVPQGQLAAALKQSGADHRMQSYLKLLYKQLNGNTAG